MSTWKFMMDISFLEGDKLKIIPVHRQPIKNILWLLLRLYLRNQCFILISEIFLKQEVIFIECLLCTKHISASHMSTHRILTTSLR